MAITAAAAVAVELWWLLGAVLYYHASELALVVWLTPEELDAQSLLVTRQYVLAMLVGLAEFWVEDALAPAWRRSVRAVALPLGLALMLAGDTIRKAAWLTARHAFTHRIKVARRAHHTLVTHGIYSWCRHPGYLGWLLWSVGTQVLLSNPVCAVLFAAVAWRFFADRIPFEEYYMYAMFGEDFIRYKARTPTRIPWIP